MSVAWADRRGASLSRRQLRRLADAAAARRPVRLASGKTGVLLYSPSSPRVAQAGNQHALAKVALGPREVVLADPGTLALIEESS